MQHGVTLPAVEIRAWPLGVAPVGARQPIPPVVVIVTRNRSRWLAEDDRAGDERFGCGAGVEGGVGRTLGHGDVAGGLHEATKGGIGDLVAVDPEAADDDLM